MKRKLVYLPLLALLVLVLSSCSTGAIRNLNSVNNKKTTLIVGLDDTFVPMGFREKNGQIVGFDVDLAKATAKKLGQKITFQAIDWNMKETELRNGTIDLIWNGYTKSPEREKQVAFSQPYLRNQQVLITMKQSNINSFADMKGKRLGLQNGSSGQTLFEEKPKVLKNLVADKTAVLYDNFNTAFLDLQAGRTQGVLGDSIYAGYYIRQQQDPDRFQITTGGFSGETFAIGMRKQDTKLKRRIDTALNELREDGTIARLSQKWFKQDLTITPKS